MVLSVFSYLQQPVQYSWDLEKELSQVDEQIDVWRRLDLRDKVYSLTSSPSNFCSLFWKKLTLPHSIESARVYSDHVYQVKKNVKAKVLSGALSPTIYGLITFAVLTENRPFSIVGIFAILTYRSLALTAFERPLINEKAYCEGAYIKSAQIQSKITEIKSSKAKLVNSVLFHFPCFLMSLGKMYSNNIITLTVNRLVIDAQRYNLYQTLDDSTKLYRKKVNKIKNVSLIAIVSLFVCRSCEQYWLFNSAAKQGLGHSPFAAEQNLWDSRKRFYDQKIMTIFAVSVIMTLHLLRFLPIRERLLHLLPPNPSLDRQVAVIRSQIKSDPTFELGCIGENDKRFSQCLKLVRDKDCWMDPVENPPTENEIDDYFTENNLMNDGFPYVLCGIGRDVVKDPVFDPISRKIYNRAKIRDWVQVNGRPPVHEDFQVLRLDHLIDLPRLRNYVHHYTLWKMRQCRDDRREE